MAHRITIGMAGKASKVVVSVLVTCVLAAIAVTIVLLVTRPTHSKPVRLIVDTDIGPWTDDVGTLAMLHTFSDRGEVQLDAIMANNAFEGVVPLIDALNVYFNRSQIAIGVTKDPNAHKDTGKLGWPEYVLANSQLFPHPNYENNSQADDAVLLYRKLLSKADDQSITILSIGYLTNLGHLLQTSSDPYSSLSGVDLVKRKVKHMVAMAGKFPSGTETNLKNQTELARVALHAWPTPLTFVGFEVGTKKQCGNNLIDYATNTSILAHSPVSKIFEMYYQWKGRLDGCFDQVAAYVAVRGVSPFFDLVHGQIELLPNGTNIWHLDAKGAQAYVKQRDGVSNSTIIDAINPLMER